MATELQTILKLTVPVIVQVGQRYVSLDGVLALAPGAILEMEKSAEKDLDLMVNNKRIGTGQAVKVGENFGIRITLIGSPQDRIEAMSGSAVS